MNFRNEGSRAMTDKEKSAVKNPGKRTRQVFPNEMLCHVWANENQETGKNSNGSLYFTGNEIYSYGSHFLAAKIHTKKDGTKYALVNSKGYSPTTGGHLSDIRGALSGKMPYYCVPNPRIADCLENIEHFNSPIIDIVGDVFNFRTKASSEAYIMAGVIRCIKEANDFLSLIGRPLIVLSNEQKNDLEALSIEKYAVKNSPEKIALKEKNALKKAEIDKENFLAEMAPKIEFYNNFTDYTFEEALENFRSGRGDFENKGVPMIFTIYVAAEQRLRLLKVEYKKLVLTDLSTKYEFLRVNEKNKTVETSRGADVPLTHAVRLLKMILKGDVGKSERVGAFTLEEIKDDPKGDKTLVIGCHRILLSEAVKVLKPYMTADLKLVVGE